MASPNPNRLSAQLSPFEAAPGRQSPFKRQHSHSPAPNASPTKASGLSSARSTSLSPEKANPFTRRPSQINVAAERPTSPFTRPTSSLSIVSSPSRKISNDSLQALEPPRSPLRSTREPEQIRSRRSSADPDATGIAALGVASPSPYDGAKQSSGDSSLSDDSPLNSMAVQVLNRDNLRPAMQRNITSSSSATVKQPLYTSHAKSATPKLSGFGGGAYNHLPQPLLHSMRESFEVLDSSNTGTVNSAAVADMLAQLGLDNTTSALKDFFPSSGPAQLNLARYLDILSGPLGEMSEPDELRAAFEAFDVDDSGQADVFMLRDALLHTAPQPGEDMIRLSEREVDSVLGEFTGRRAFGTKGITAGKSKGEVFRYRDFMASVSGGAGPTKSEAEAVIAA